MKLKFLLWKRQYFRYLLSVINIPLSSIIFSVWCDHKLQQLSVQLRHIYFWKQMILYLHKNKVLFSTLISRRDNKFEWRHSDFPQKNILLNCRHLLEWQVKIRIFHDEFLSCNSVTKVCRYPCDGHSIKGGYTGIKIIMLLKLQSNT